MIDALQINDEVAGALAAGEAVVALESTIITHGLPRPTNLEVATALEDRVREGGAVPATICVLDGALRVGLGAGELARLAEPGDALKVSRRDIPFVLRSGAMGGTTVSATMFVAALAGVNVFATGGIGGVHRGAAETFDVSADLQELARSDVAVVSAGFKSILDIGLTLEYLESLAVPVVGYRTRTLPEFYVRGGKFVLDHSVELASEVADIMLLRRELGISGGIVVANPIPESDALDPEQMESSIATALVEATAQGIGGKDVTPFLLERIAEITQSESLLANRALVLNNGAVATEIALQLATRT
ncbi:MAG: pseudouridine-5'-phosphate glycosidase [Acidimicrobiales bacterium]